MRSDYDQMCRKRRWLFGLLKEGIQSQANLMATLDESISEPMNPDRYDDAILRWQIKPDLEIMMPLLEDAFQPGGYPSDSAIKLAVVIGDQAMSLLEPFLLHENESRRIDIRLKNLSQP